MVCDMTTEPLLRPRHMLAARVAQSATETMPRVQLWTIALKIYDAAWHVCRNNPCIAARGALNSAAIALGLVHDLAPQPTIAETRPAVAELRKAGSKLERIERA